MPSQGAHNNRAERVERGPVVLRKNSYGSGSVRAAQMAAVLFSLFQTLCLWNINPRAWLTAYLHACAESGGKAPRELDRFLPWHLDEAQRRAWALEPRPEAINSS